MSAFSWQMMGALRAHKLTAIENNDSVVQQSFVYETYLIFGVVLQMLCIL
jgi:hypothetical protein